eukprot:13285-Heterococcus_DN1.PRE.1
MWIPVKRSWRLNERHYGALQGLNKQETVDKHGKDQVLVWRRSYDIPPPELDEDSVHYPGNDRRYKDVDKLKLLRIQVSAKLLVLIPPRLLIPHCYHMVPALTLCALINDPSSLVHSQQALLPKTESLKTTEARFLVEWEDNIKGDIKSGKKVLLPFHGTGTTTASVAVQLRGAAGAMLYATHCS